MTKVKINLTKKKQAYGRVDYYPDCLDSFYILSFSKNRLAFREKEILYMRELGWELDIKEELREKQMITKTCASCGKELREDVGNGFVTTFMGKTKPLKFECWDCHKANELKKVKK